MTDQATSSTTKISAKSQNTANDITASNESTTEHVKNDKNNANECVEDHHPKEHDATNNNPNINDKLQKNDEDEKDNDNDNDDEMDTNNDQAMMDSNENIIHCMRTALEDQLRRIESPMPLCTRPQQRQRWEDIQETPHKEWGDIFFDLFYVAGAYNLGNLLKEEPTSRGLLYFFACFFSLQSLWQYKMYYDSRFFTLNDVWHNFYDVCNLVVVATAVLHIRPVSLLSNPEEYIDLFLFCLSISIAMILLTGRSIEVVFFVQGEEAAKIASKRDAIMYIIMTSFFAAATIYAGVKYYSNNDNTSDNDPSYLYGASNGHYDDSHVGYSNNITVNDTHAYNSTVGDEYNTDTNHHIRFLAGEAASAAYENHTDRNNYRGDIAMYLLLAGYVFNHLLWFLVVTLLMRRLGDFKKITVPMNIDYAIHRYGEWIMLMLGESVLSLLIVGVKERDDFYKTFYCGIISIALLENLHFRSQPHHADEHAMRRNKERGYAFLILVQLFSAALIILGASYKMLLYEFIYEDYDKDEGEDDSHRRGLLFTLPRKTFLHRWLAGGEGGALLFDKEDRQQRIANFFCGSMSAVFLLSDLLIVVHKGIKEHMEHCRNTPAPKVVKLLAPLLLFVRLGVIAFFASLSQYVTDGSMLAFVGLVCIVVELMLRVVGTALYREETEEDEAFREILNHGITAELD